jgi:ferredoxin
MKCRFKVDKDLCIPAMACIVAEPDIYELDDTGKADIKKQLTTDQIVAKMRDNDGWVEVDTDETGLNRLVDSAKVCPVLAIFVDKFDEKTNDWVRIYPE